MAFDDLTKRQRLPVLREVALEVLRADYAIEPRRLRLLSLSFNTLFRVDRFDGPPLVLRLCGRERIHAPGVEAVEAAWLDRIATDLGWAVPRCVPALDGRVVVPGTHPAVPRPVPGSLFTWVRGRPLDDDLDAVDAGAIGGLLAELHRHAAALAERAEGPMATDIMTPQMVGAIRADRVVYFGDEGAVADVGGGTLLREAIERGRALLDELWSSSGRPHLLHGDYGPSNVLRWRRTLTPIDVQDLQVGHAVQDVGLTIADLLDAGLPTPVVAAFRHGYEVGGGIEISDDQVAEFAALRSLNMIGFCLGSPRPGLEATIEQSVATVRRWMLPT